MANPYTITYKFGRLVDVGQSIAGNHLIRMSMQFIVNTDGNDTVKLASEYGIYVVTWGEGVWERELDNNFVVPGRYQFKLFDSDGELESLLFEGSLVPYVNKDAKITLEIKYYGDENYSVEYVGFIDNTNIGLKNKELSLIALPKIDQLKSIYLYVTNEDGRLVGKNPLSLNYFVNNDYYTADNLNCKTLIHKIYQVINSACTLDWQHNWIYRINVGGSPDYLLDQLQFTGNYLSGLFFSIDNRRQVENLYDLITRLSFSFGFITGMLTSDRAFVKDIFSYNPNNTQSLGQVFSLTKSNKYGDIDAAKITMRYFDRDWVTNFKNAYRQTRARTSIVPSQNAMRGDIIIDDELVLYIDNDVNFSGSDLRVFYIDQNYPIKGVKLPKIAGASTYTLAEAVAIFNYNLRNRQKISQAAGITASIGRVDTFQVDGIKYDYMKDFSFDGNGYQILSLRKTFDTNLSVIDALYVTDAMEDIPVDEGTPEPQKMVNVLPGGYLRDYSYNAEIEPDDVNQGTFDLFDMPENFELKKIILKINNKLNNVTSMKLVDEDGDLIPAERINNEDDEVIESYQYKNYAAPKKISAVFTTSGQCTQGDADVIFELRSKL